MKTNQKRSRTTVTVIGLALSVLTGCQTPDLKPFRDSTPKIHDSVVDAKDVYLEEQQRIRPYLPDSAKDKLDKQMARFQTNWVARVSIMEAMVRYASSLAAVAEAPDKSKAAIDGVASAAAELGIVPLGSTRDEMQASQPI